MAKNNKPNIEQLPSGSYRWRKRVFIDGRSKRLQGTKKTYKDAVSDMYAAVNKAMTERSNDNQPTSTSLTVADLVREHIATESARWAPATRIHNDGWFERHILPDLGHIKAADLTPEMLRKFYAKRSHLSYSALNQIKSLLNGGYKKALIKRLLDYNPIGLQTIGKSNSGAVGCEKFLTTTEAEIFNAVAKKDRFGMILSFLLLTGLRIGEACALKWSAIDQHANESGKLWGLHVRESRTERNGKIIEGTTKSYSSSRYIYISNEAKELLQEVKRLQKIEATLHGSSDPHVFLSTTGEPLRQDVLRNVMRRLCKDAQVKIISPHGLRHTFASIMIMEGADVTQVSSHLGHKDIIITLKYYRHLFEKEKQGVVLSLNAPEEVPERDPSRRTRKPSRLPNRGPRTE